MVEHVVEARIESIAETMARLEAAREQVAPKIEAALERYVERVERDAFKANLDMLDCVNWALEEAEARIWQKYSDDDSALFDSCKKCNRGTNVRRVVQFRGDKRHNEPQLLYFL